MLSRVAVGLMQEGVTTAIATPRSVDGADTAQNGLTTHVAYEDLGWSVTLRTRALALLRLLASDEYAGWGSGGGRGGRGTRRAKGGGGGGGGEPPIDIIHAWGHASWPMAVALARETDAAVVLDAWSVEACDQIRRTERSATHGHEEGVRGMWLAPSRALLAQAEPRAHLWPCQLLHWGVYAPDKLPPLEHKSQHALSVVCSGESPEATAAMLKGIAQIVPEFPDLLVFLDEAAVASDHALWRIAQSLGLLDRLSVIAEMESRRDLVLQTDLLLLPDVAGETRSIILDAMASGVLVIANASTSSDAVIDGRTAITIPTRTPEQWARAIKSVLADADTFASIRNDAHRMILTERRGHTHVAALMSVYEDLASTEPIAFKPEN